MQNAIAQMVSERFGGKRALLRLLASQWRHALQRVGMAAPVRAGKVQRLVFVCKGNICRSPFGEGVARAIGVESCSFGLDAEPGVPCNPRALETARARGIDLARHRATHIDQYQPRDGDLVLCFDSEQLAELQQRCGTRALVQLLGQWHAPAMPYLHDPYGLSPAYFQACFERIDSSVRALAQQMPARAGATT